MKTTTEFYTVSTDLFDACDFSVLLTVSIFFFAIGGVMDSFTILDFFMSVLPYLITVLVVVTNAFLVSSKSPLVFLSVILGLSDLFGNGSLIFEDMIVS